MWRSNATHPETGEARRILIERTGDSTWGPSGRFISARGSSWGCTQKRTDVFQEI